MYLRTFLISNVRTYLPSYLPTYLTCTYLTYLPTYLPTYGRCNEQEIWNKKCREWLQCLLLRSARTNERKNFSFMCERISERERKRVCVWFVWLWGVWEWVRERERERVRKREKESEKERERERVRKRERDLYVCAILRLEFRSATPFSFILFSHSKIAPFVGSFFYLPLTI